MMAIVAVVGPVPAVPIAWGSGIICIWIPGIWIVVNVRMPILSIRIMIVTRRIRGVAARKSKTESLSSGNQDGGLSVSTLPGNEGQPAYRQFNQEKLLHRFTSSICFGFCLLFCAGRLRVFLYRGIRMRPASRLPRRIKNAVAFFDATRRSERVKNCVHCRYDLEVQGSCVVMRVRD